MTHLSFPVCAFLSLSQLPVQRPSNPGAFPAPDAAAVLHSFSKVEQPVAKKRPKSKASKETAGLILSLKASMIGSVRIEMKRFEGLRVLESRPGFKKCMRLVKLATTEDLSNAGFLLAQYEAELNDKTCFSNFQEELNNLGSLYLPPNGAFWLAREDTGADIGCVALRFMPGCRTAEIKRLYVVKNRRGYGIGKVLLNAALEHAHNCEVAEVCLETLPSMKEARNLYAAAGFVVEEPSSGCSKVITMQLKLAPSEESDRASDRTSE